NQITENINNLGDELLTYIANDTTFVTNLVENNYFTETLSSDTTFVTNLVNNEYFITNLVTDSVFLSELYDDTHLKQMIDSIASLIRSGADTVLIQEIVNKILSDTTLVSQIFNDTTVINNIISELYNDTHILQLLDSLLSKTNAVDTIFNTIVYDDSKLQTLIDSLLSKTNAVDTIFNTIVYDDSKLQTLIDSLLSKTNAVDTIFNTITYDDSKLQTLIDSLLKKTNAVDTIFNTIVYDDSKLQSLIDSLLSKTNAVDTIFNTIVYDDSKLQSLIDSLLSKTNLGDTIINYITNNFPPELGDTILNYITNNVTQALTDSILTYLSVTSADNTVNITRSGSDFDLSVNIAVVGDSLVNNNTFVTNLGDELVQNSQFITNLGDTLVNNNNFITQLSHDTTFINNLVTDSVFLSQFYDDTHLKQMIDSIASLIKSGGDTTLIKEIVNQITKETNIIQLGDSLAYYFSQTVLGDTIANNLLNNNQYITNLIDTLKAYLEDNNTLYTAGYGLNLNGTEFSANIQEILDSLESNLNNGIAKVNGERGIETQLIGDSLVISLPEGQGNMLYVLKWDGGLSKWVAAKDDNIYYADETTLHLDAFKKFSIKNGGVQNIHIANDAVTSSKIADGTIVTADLADNSVNSAKIIDGTIATVDIANNAVTVAKLPTGAAAGKYLDGDGTWKPGVVSGNITKNDLSTTLWNTISKDTIVGNEVFELTAGTALTRTGTKAAGYTLGVTDGGIGTTQLANNAVTTAKLADNSVNSAKIIDGTIATVDIADNAVTVAKLPTGATATTFLRGDGIWVTPTNTTYTGSASVTLNGTSFERAALTGDVTAAANNNATTVTAIRGTNIVATAPTNGQVLKYNGTNWAPAADAGLTAEVDGIIGNEVTDAANTTLTRTGAGSNANPYKLKANPAVIADSIAKIFDATLLKDTVLKLIKDSTAAGWLLTGNAVEDGQFLGTTNNKPLIFRVNNDTAGIITQYNTALGYQAMEKNGGYNNVAIGNGTLASNMYGYGNVALGTQALENGIGDSQNNWRNSDNVAIGRSAMRQNTIGGRNIAIGANALSAPLTDNANWRNVAIGYEAMRDATGANVEDNVAIGAGALANETTRYNTAIGTFALNNHKIGYGNTAIGYAAGTSGETGTQNIAIGYLATITSGLSDYPNDNIVIGNNANLPSGSSQLNIGNKIYGVGTGVSARIAIGKTVPDVAAVLDLQDAATNLGLLLPKVALTDISVWAPLAGGTPKNGMTVYNESGSVANGVYTWYNNKWNKGTDGGATTEPWNQMNTTNPSTANTQDSYLNAKLAIGTNNAASINGGTNNAQLTVVGGDASINGVIVGKGGGNVGSNTAVGRIALSNNTTGESNSAFGYGALNYNTEGELNNAFGYSALLMNTAGGNNNAFGYAALGRNTSGYENSAFGGGALTYTTTGGRNTAIGYQAGSNITTGSNNITIGFNTDARSATANYQLNIGNAIFGTGLSGTVSAPAGNIGIGTASPTSKLEVNGAATNTAAYNGLDFTKSNLAYTTSTATALTLIGMKDGGTYTLAVQGGASRTVTFTIAGFTVKYVNNTATTANTDTLYTFLCIGNVVYVYQTKGFN
ncbi:MAG: hypothetical protein LBN27_04675, partial [Prevotellaceae bacterium]|nr:hypothetical protein [Prevotellaceae bacterium]